MHAWVSNNGSSDLAQPDRRPADNTAISGSAAIREALVDYFNNYIMYYRNIVYTDLSGYVHTYLYINPHITYVCLHLLDLCKIIIIR